MGAYSPAVSRQAASEVNAPARLVTLSGDEWEIVPDGWRHFADGQRTERLRFTSGDSILFGQLTTTTSFQTATGEQLLHALQEAILGVEQELAESLAAASLANMQLGAHLITWKGVLFDSRGSAESFAAHFDKTVVAGADGQWLAANKIDPDDKGTL